MKGDIDPAVHYDLLAFIATHFCAAMPGAPRNSPAVFAIEWTLRCAKVTVILESYYTTVILKSNPMADLKRRMPVSRVLNLAFTFAFPFSLSRCTIPGVAPCRATPQRVPRHDVARRRATYMSEF
eukprot:IDg12598t1